MFTAFGFLYVGAAQHALFNHLFPRLLPGLAKRSLSSVVAASLLDNFVHMPFAYLPVFYCIREVAHSDTSSLPQAVSDGLGFYREHFAEDVGLQALIFMPVQMANFRFNPPHLRVPTVVAAGVVWISLLSLLRGDRSKEV